MIKKILFGVVVGLVVVGMSGVSFAMCGACGTGEKSAAAAPAQTKAIDVGNKVCPVMGEKIDAKSKVTQEYNGKNYNLCCPKCVSEFQKDPKKYAEIADKEVKATAVQAK
jgi:YHS domain-containing protein